MTNNDLELTMWEREVLKNAGDLSATIRNESLNAVIDKVAAIEDAARKLGWRAVNLRDEALQKVLNSSS